MANQTDPLAASVHGTNPQNLIEKILRGRIYENRYWKEHCFGLSAETLLDKAVKLDGIGGIYSHNAKPTPFICLALKLLQIQPEREIIEEYLKQEDFKYLRALAAFYVRLTYRARDVYQLIEPLLSDYRKLCVRSLSAAAGAGGWKVTHMDEFLDELLTAEMSCDVILPHLPRRETLVNSGMLNGPRISTLDDELNEEEDEEEEEDKEESQPERAHHTSHSGEKTLSSTNSLANMFKRAQVRQRNDAANEDEERETQRRRIDDAQESSQSLQEANALRTKLGLKPLRP